MGTQLAVLTLPSTPEAPALAREHVRNLGSSWPSQVLDGLLLAVSEAATNAVRYGQGGIELGAQVGDDTARIEVSDLNREPPTPAPTPYP